MRTTITMDSRLMDRLKKRAAESDTSVSRLIERAVQILLRERPSNPAAHFELVTFGEGGQFTTRNVDKTARLLEEDDIDLFGKAR
jgi:predicted transcriptional regulator